jgi:phosphoribosyl-ATP pyrophosphohydrolase/phosphoribosyl-AMP cyclohydrolase
MSWLDELKFDAGGLVPVVAQDVSSGDVLMVAYANRSALEQTSRSGRAHYWSRSRAEIWRKGDTSGHIQEVVEIRLDCDADSVLYRVRQTGPACHTGEASCFFRRIENGSLEPAPPAGHILARIDAIVANRAEERPEGSYTTYLFEEGVDKILKKVGEEATEVVIAAKNEAAAELRAEVADLLFHLIVLLRVSDLPLADVWSELEGRFGASSRVPGPRSSLHPNS